jgi:hypothetical protein
MGLQPTQDYETLGLSQICHLDRSVPGFPVTLHQTEPRVRLSSKKAHELHQRHQLPQEIRGSAWRDLRCQLVLTQNL